MDYRLKLAGRKQEPTSTISKSRSAWEFTRHSQQNSPLLTKFNTPTLYPYSYLKIWVLWPSLILQQC